MLRRDEFNFEIVSRRIYLKQRRNCENFAKPCASPLTRQLFEAIILTCVGLTGQSLANGGKGL